MKEADLPFAFDTAPFLSRINNQVVGNLAELRDGIAHSSDASIFYHTYQTLGRNHFLTEGFSNDFAQWVLASLNRAGLAERLGGIDVRDYVSIAEIRADLVRMITDHCEADPRDAQLSAFEPFYFLEAVEVTVPLGVTANNLTEFRNGINHIGHASFYHHFIASRLRLQLQTNDFSYWLENSLGLSELARRCNQIDVYANTIDTVRQKMTAYIDQELRYDRH